MWLYGDRRFQHAAVGTKRGTPPFDPHSPYIHFRNRFILEFLMKMWFHDDRRFQQAENRYRIARRHEREERQELGGVPRGSARRPAPPLQVRNPLLFERIFRNSRGIASILEESCRSHGCVRNDLERSILGAASQIREIQPQGSARRPASPASFAFCSCSSPLPLPPPFPGFELQIEGLKFRI